MKDIVYGAGGFAPTSYWVQQRIDEGVDIEIKLGDHLRAPGDGQVLEWAHDRAFPNGFGDPYAVVDFTTGPFASVGPIYLGHINSDVPPVGTHFKEGDRLGRATNSLNAGRGWAEIGLWPPGGMSNGSKIAHLFVDVHVPRPFMSLRRGARGLRVLRLSRRLRYIRQPSGPTYLQHLTTRYGIRMEEAVKRFQHRHSLKMDGVVGLRTSQEIERVFRHQRASRE